MRLIYTSRHSIDFIAWWRHQMETFSALLALCAGNSPVPVNSPHKGQWRGTLMLSLICHWINGWVNNREAGDLRRHQAHYDVIVMSQHIDRVQLCTMKLDETNFLATTVWIYNECWFQHVTGWWTIIIICDKLLYIHMHLYDLANANGSRHRLSWLITNSDNLTLRLEQ